jgi:hypothetical protein
VACGSRARTSATCARSPSASDAVRSRVAPGSREHDAADRQVERGGEGPRAGAWILIVPA